MIKRIGIALITGFGSLFLLAGCGQRQDSSSRGDVYEVTSYTTAKGQVKKAPATVAMTLSLSSDDDRGVLSTATLAQSPYYRRYEMLTRKPSGDQTQLTATGEVAALNFSNAADARDGVNPTKYSYSQKGDATKVGTFTKTKAGLDLQLGKTTWHFKQTEKKTRYLLPYGIVKQAKDAKVDKGN